MNEMLQLRTVPWKGRDIRVYPAELGRVKRRAIDGVGQALTYDALGRVTVVTNALGAFTNEYVGVTARIATNHFPNGQQILFMYYGTNDDLRLQEIRHTSTNAQLSAFGYTYDPAGKVVTWTQQPGTGNTNIWVTGYDPVPMPIIGLSRATTIILVLPIRVNLCPSKDT